MGPRGFPYHIFSAGRADTTGRAAAGRPVDILPTGAAFVPPADAAPVGVTRTFDLETALPGGPTCVTCWYWKPTVGDQCEACHDDTEARS